MLYVLNFKTYQESTGENSLRLLHAVQTVAHETNADIIAALQPMDMLLGVKNNVRTFAQHIDPVSYGSNTGSILPEAVKAAGAQGTLINHSEKRLSLETIEKTILRAKQLGLTTVVCVATAEECAAVGKFSPDYVAIEPHDLISSGRSVSKERPELITKAREMLPVHIPLLCGAGVSTREDVLKAKELGCDGVLLASAFVKAQNPAEKLRELVIEKPLVAKVSAR